MNFSADSTPLKGSRRKNSFDQSWGSPIIALRHQRTLGPPSSRSSGPALQKHDGPHAGPYLGPDAGPRGQQFTQENSEIGRVGGRVLVTCKGGEQMGSDPRLARIAAPNARPLGSLPFARRGQLAAPARVLSASLAVHAQGHTSRVGPVRSYATVVLRNVAGSVCRRGPCRGVVEHLGEARDGASFAMLRSIACWLFGALGAIAESRCGRRSVIVSGSGAC